MIRELFQVELLHRDLDKGIHQLYELAEAEHRARELAHDKEQAQIEQKNDQRLALIGTIFLPLTLFSGLMGMNNFVNQATSTSEPSCGDGVRGSLCELFYQASAGETIAFGVVITFTLSAFVYFSQKKYKLIHNLTLTSVVFALFAAGYFFL